MQGRHVHLVLENDHNDASLLSAGFDAQWNDDAHHALHVLLTGEQDGYYRDYGAAHGSRNPPLRHLARVLAEGFAYQGEVSPFRSAAEARARRRGAAGPAAICRPLPLSASCRTMTRPATAPSANGWPPWPAQALRAAVALQLLCPHVPLVFMGEECGAQTPFYYFTSHPPELAEAVRQGRRREFAAMAAFGDDMRAHDIPDPNDPATFEASRPPLTPRMTGPATTGDCSRSGTSGSRTGCRAPAAPASMFSPRCARAGVWATGPACRSG